MSTESIRRLGVALVALGLTACGGPIVHDLVPLPGKESSAPEITEVNHVVFETTEGDIRIAVYPEAAPNAAQRFVELVEVGYYDGTPVFRIVPDFVAQFGINWRDPHNEWQNRNFEDDPRWFAHERGTLSFAKSGRPDTASTQVFINFKENSFLAVEDPGYRFSVFGMVVEGMDIVDRFAQVGEMNQGRLWSNGDDYIDSLSLKPTMIERARVDNVPE